MNTKKSEDDERRAFDYLSHSLSLKHTQTHKHSLFLYPRVMMTNGSNGVNSAFVYE